MKLVLHLITILVLATSCFYSNEKSVKFSVLVEKRISGNVLNLQESVYSCDSAGNIGEMQECCVVTDEFNEDGNIISQEITDRNGTPIMSVTITLRANGLRESLTSSKGGKIVSFAQNYFNDAGDYSGQVIRDSTNRKQKCYSILKMNNYGQWVTFIEYDKDSVIVMKEDSKFENNLLTKAWQTDRNGKTLAKYDYRYNEKGHLIEISVVEMTDAGEKKTVTKDSYDEFDDKGNWVRRTLWDEKGKAVRIEKRKFTYRN